MITVAGLGFVGLTTALGFCEKELKVIGYDVDKTKTESLKNQKIPFYEAGLENDLKRHLGKNFTICDTFPEAIKNSKIIFLCVGTPSDEKGRADLKYIKSATDEILAVSTPEDKKIIVIKSTVPPSTCEKEIIPYVKNKGFTPGVDIFIANNPEFLREGHARSDFMNPDRIVIGLNEEYPKEFLKEIYKGFNAPLCFVSLNTGEFIKYLSNTFLATLISFSNEMSMVADSIGNIDIKNAFKIFALDKRWSGSPAAMSTYAYPGCGFGGYCLPKDTSALIQKAKENDYEANILKNVLNVNSEIKRHLTDKIKSEIEPKEKITVLGLSFKPESDDIRQTPAYEIINLLLKDGYNNITAYDPLANELFKKTYGLKINYADSLENALKNSNAVIILTGWKEFIENKKLFENKKTFDLRYIL